MSMESIIQLAKAKKVSTPVSEDYFTRISYILDNDTSKTFEEFFGNTKSKNTKDLIMKYNMLSKLTPIERDPQKSLKVYPFYLSSIKNMRLIKSVAEEMKPISWAVPYCNTSDDLAYCLLLLRTSDVEQYKKILDKYAPETVGNYIVLKDAEKKLKGFFKKIEKEN
jgi:hypothetical protein